ncbi:MAG: hypothetical protein K6E91_08055 [Butyrivibrio sp.]|nr:hypothetical protein [Butyrivibrio sp.]
MADTKQMLFSKNLICLCIDGNENADYQGKLYHQYSDDAIEFRGLTDAVIRTEELFDEWDFPQRGLAQRRFKKHTREEKRPKPGADGDDRLPIEIIRDEKGVRNVQNKKGALGTFIIQVRYRQRASWQGQVIWLEKNELMDFISVLELLKIIDSSMQTDTSNKE